MYRAGIESILGIQKQGGYLLMNPCIPTQWPGFQVIFRHASARYEIVVENPEGVCSGVASLALDGIVLPQQTRIPLHDDGATHQVKIVLGSREWPLAPGDGPRADVAGRPTLMAREH